MRSLERLSILWAAACFALGCGEAEGTPGSLMLAISTDMYVDKDVSQVDIIVQPEHGQAHTAQINLFPGLEGQFLPGTFSITEGSKPGEFVRIRVIARQTDRVRVVREAALKIPRRRTALLSMPIQWLCDGHVREEDDQHRSDCEENYTCISGSCQPDAVDETSLPDYEPSEVFGGGSATGGGECFDTLACFAGAMQPPLDLETCRLSLSPSANLNLGVVLPPGSDGHCTNTECWIPLDRSELTGWWEADGAVQLPSGVCERVMSSGARVLASAACESKLPNTPTCGPWTLVGTEPGGILPPDIDVPGVVTNEDVVQELRTASQRLASEVLVACSSVAGLTPGQASGSAEIESACTQAKAIIQPLGALTWHHVPVRCWPDSERRLECENDCNSECDGGDVAERCTATLAGVCAGVCESRKCLGSELAPVDCAGACGGQCEGTCEGSCLGQCVGECAAPSPAGHCDGHCAGTCLGLCQGRCEGTCEGSCDGDPNLEPAACTDGAVCLGGCAGELENPTCDAPLELSTCQLPAGCEGNCQVLSQFGTECDRPGVWLMNPAGADPATMATLASALPDLITIRDRKAAAVLDEATRLLQRMNVDPSAAAEDVAQVQADVDLLQSLITNASSFLAVLGPERFGAGGVTPGPISCDVLAATGGAPLIDDFEDGNATLLANDGRSGNWYVIQDGTGQLTNGSPPVPESGGANGSGKAMHLAGSGFTMWGAGLSLELRPGSAPYDASVHQGLRFWARGTGRVRVVFMQTDLAPAHACSTCDVSSGQCGAFYKTEVFLSSIWSEIVIPWTVLTRDFEGGSPFAPERLMTVQFEAPAPEAIDFWLDDVAFY